VSTYSTSTCLHVKCQVSTWHVFQTCRVISFFDCYSAQVLCATRKDENPKKDGDFLLYPLQDFCPSANSTFTFWTLCKKTTTINNRSSGEPFPRRTNLAHEMRWASKASRNHLGYVLGSPSTLFSIEGSTPPKTNMEPKNGDLEDDFPFQRDDFHVPC